MSLENDLPIKKRGITFDATINLGHILTFVGFLVTGFMAWQTMDKRVIILEQTTRLQELRDKTQDSEQSSQALHINESLLDIKRSVEKLADKIDSK